MNMLRENNGGRPVKRRQDMPGLHPVSNLILQWGIFSRRKSLRSDSGNRQH